MQLAEVYYLQCILLYMYVLKQGIFLFYRNPTLLVIMVKVTLSKSQNCPLADECSMQVPCKNVTITTDATYQSKSDLSFSKALTSCGEQDSPSPALGNRYKVFCSKVYIILTNWTTTSL